MLLYRLAFAISSTCLLQVREMLFFVIHNTEDDTSDGYAGTSLSCAGIQRWKSVSFCCWAAINWLVRWAMRNRTPHPYHTYPFPSSLCEEFYILACSWWAMKSRTPHPTLPTLFLPHCVKSSAWVIICVFHACLLQSQHTETLRVWLILFWDDYKNYCNLMADAIAMFLLWWMICQCYLHSWWFYFVLRYYANVIIFIWQMVLPVYVLWQMVLPVFILRVV